MTTPSDVGADVVAAMAAASTAVATGTRRALVEIGDAARREMEQAAGRVVPGGRLRNHGGSRFSVTVTAGDDELEVIPRGPWGILEPGARVHLINAGRPMPAGPGRFRWGPFRHPGTPDTGAWSAGYDQTAAEADRIFPEIVGDEVASAFDG